MGKKPSVYDDLGFTSTGDVKPAIESSAAATKAAEPTGEPDLGFNDPIPNQSPLERVSKSKQYAEGFIEGTELDRSIAQNQGKVEEFANMFGRVGLNFVPGVIGSVAGMVDPNDWNAGWDQEQDIGNAVTRWAGNLRQTVDQDLLPVYRQDPNKVLDIGSSEWWADNGSGILGSAAEFALLGFGVGSLLTKGASALKWLTTLDAAAGAAAAEGVAGAKRLNTLGQSLVLGTSALAMNHAEGILEATQVYGMELEKNMELVRQGKLSEEEAKTRAADAAGHSVNLNRANIFLNLTGMSSILKAARGSRNIIRTLATPYKVALEGGQEYLEETVNNYAQNRATEYGEAIRTGQPYTGDTVAKFVNDALSPKGVEAGFLGAIGGAGQVAAVGVGKKLRGGEDVEQVYAEEQKTYKTSIEALAEEQRLKSLRDIGVTAVTMTNLVSTRDTLEKEMQKDYAEGKPTNPNLVARIQDVNAEIQSESLIASFNSGTAEYLQKGYEDIAALSDEDARKNGYSGAELDEKSPAYYKTTAKKMLENMHRLEQIYNSVGGKQNALDLIRNRAQAFKVRDHWEFFSKKEAEIAADAQLAVDDLLRPPSLKLPGISGLGELDINKLKDKDYEKITGVLDESVAKTRRALIEQAETLPEVKALRDVQAAKEAAQTQLKKLNKEYNEGNSKEYQKKLEEDAALQRKEAQDALKELEKINLANKQKTEDIAKKSAVQHELNFKAFGEKMVQEGLDHEEVAALQAMIKKELATPLEQPVSYTPEEEVLQENYPQLVADYRKFLKSTTIAKQEVKKANPLVFTASDNDDIELEYSTLDKDGLPAFAKVTVNKETGEVENQNLLDRANNVMAWKARDYNVTVTPNLGRKFSDVNNKLTDELKDPSILDARNLKVGDEVILRLDPNGPVMRTDDEGNEFAQSWDEAVADATVKGKLDELHYIAPIGIYKPGATTPMGYVHLASWITPARVKGDAAQVAADKKKVNDIRYHVMYRADKNTGVSTKVVQRTLGKLFLDSTKETKPVSENIKDPSIKYAVFLQNRFLTETRAADTSLSVLNRDALRSGWTYALLPVEKNADPKLTKFWAVPMKVSKIPQEVIDSVVRASIIYTNAITGNLTDADNKIADSINLLQKNVSEKGTPINFDIRTEQGIRNYTELYVYNHTKHDISDEAEVDSKGKTIKKPITLERWASQTNLPADYYASDFDRTGLHFYSGEKGMVPNTGGLPYIEAWTDHLRNRYQHTNLRFMNNTTVKLPVIKTDGSVVELAPGNSYLSYLKQNAWSTNVMGQNIAEGNEAPNYVYTIQQIIEFDTAAMGVDNSITTEEDRVERAKARQDLQRGKTPTKVAVTPADFQAEWKKALADIAAADKVSTITRLFPVQLNNTVSDPLAQAKADAISYVNKHYQDLIDAATLKAEKAKAKKEPAKLKAEDTTQPTITPAAGEKPRLKTVEEIEAETAEEFKNFKGFGNIGKKNNKGPQKPPEPAVDKMPALAAFGEEAAEESDSNKTAVTGEVVITEAQTKVNVQSEAQVQSILSAGMLKDETAYQNLKSKYALPLSPHFDNALLRDMLAYWQDVVLRAYNEITENDTKTDKPEIVILQNVLGNVKEHLQYQVKHLPESQFPKHYNAAKYTLENWDVMQDLLKHNLQRDGQFRFKKVKFEEQDEDMVNDAPALEDGDRDENFPEGKIESQSQQERWMMDSLQQDPAKGLSSRFRRFLGNIQDTSRRYILGLETELDEVDENGDVVIDAETGKPKKQKSGHPNFKPVRLYRTLSALLSDTDADFDKMLGIMEKAALRPGFAYLNTVRQALMNADEQIKAEFVVTMSKHYVNMKHLYVVARYGKDFVKYYESTVRDDNYNAKAVVVQDRWEHDMYLSAVALPYTGTDIREDRIMYDKNSVQTLIEMFEESLMVIDPKTGERVRPTAKNLAEQDVADFPVTTWLAMMGINLSPSALPVLKVNGTSKKKSTEKVGKQNFKDMFYADSGEFWRLYRFLKDRIVAVPGDVFLENSPITGDSSVYRLAYFDTQFVNDAHSNSHDSGNKSVFSYTDNKAVFDKARQLGAVAGSTEVDYQLLEDLVNDPFVGKNSWDLRQLLKFDETTQEFVRDENNRLIYLSEDDFAKNFKIAYTSLSVLIQKGVPVGHRNALEDLDPREHIITKMMMFQNKGTAPAEGLRRGQLFHMTLSNKNTMILFEKSIPNIGVNEDGSIDEATVNMMFNFMVLPEINRMLKFNKTYAPNIKGYAEGLNLFYLFPKLNQQDELFNSFVDGDGNLNRSIRPDLETNVKLRGIINDVIKETISKEIAFTKQNWEANGLLHKSKDGKIVSLDYLDGQYAGWVRTKIRKSDQLTPESKIINYLAAEMAVSYMMHDTNLFQLFVGDPATYFKSDSADPFTQVWDTYDNISKRLSSEVTPGRDPYTQQTGTEYTLGVMKDIKIPSKALEVYKKFFKDRPELLEKYEKINSTDGAEFITLPEKLRFMREFAKLNPTQLAALDGIEANYEKSIAAIAAGKDPSKYDLSYSQLELIFQVDKPIMVGYRIDKPSGVQTRVMVKSAAFTLIPELVRGTELEKLMVMMSDKKNPVHRMAMESAMKLGGPVTVKKLFDDKGKFIEGSTMDPIKDVFVLPRKFLRLQQETPYKETTDIARVSQASKQAFLNVLDVKGFRLPGEKAMTGRELYEKHYLKQYEFLYKDSYNKLVKKLGITTHPETGEVTLNHRKLSNLIQDELVNRGYPPHDLDALEIEQIPAQEYDAVGNEIPLPADVEVTWRFKMPIWAAAKSGKLEAFLNSIVTNNVLKQKFNGYGFVLGPEAGYQFSEKVKDKDGKTLEKGVARSVEELSSDLKNRILFTSKYDPAVGLKPSQINNGYHQVILPWKFKENIKDYVKDGMLDMDMMDESLLKAFGMRIPNQGPNSTAAIEIVGFFPPAAGDLLVAPADFVTQMGSDFDIDKLFTYMYHYVKVSGKLVRADTGSVAELQIKLDKQADQVQAMLTKLDDSEIPSDAEREAAKDNPDLTAELKDKYPAWSEWKAAYDVYVFDKLTLKDLVEKGDSTENTREKAQNRILDIHLAINTNMDPFVQKLITTPLVTGMEVIADTIETSQRRRAQESSTLDKVSVHDLSPASGSYQSFKYESSVIASAAISAFAVQNTFNALTQTVPDGLSMVRKWADDTDNGQIIYAHLKFGKEKFQGKHNLSNAASLGKKGNYKSNNISAMLSAALDDGTESILGRIGVNQVNLSVTNFLLQAGFELETIAAFLSQDVILEYTKQMGIYNNDSGKAYKAVMKQDQFAFEDKDFKNRGREAKPEDAELTWEDIHDDEAFEKDYYDSFIPDLPPLPVKEQFWNFYNMGVDELLELIDQGPKAPGYKKAQYALLMKYQDVDTFHARPLRKLQAMSNVDSKGIGANMFQSLVQEEDMASLGDPAKVPVENAMGLFGDFVELNSKTETDIKKLESGDYVKGRFFHFKPTSIPGFAFAYGVIPNNKIWKKHFPYADDRVLAAIEQIASKMKSGSESVFSKAERNKKIFRELKSYAYTHGMITLSNPEILRKLLLHDYVNPPENAADTRTDEERRHRSLATLLYKFRENHETAKIFRENAFLNNLYVKPFKNASDPRVIMFRQPNDDETTNRDIYNEVYNLVKYPVALGEFNGIQYNTRKFIEQIMLSANVSMQSALQLNLMQYMPTELMVDSGLADRLHKVDWQILLMNQNESEPFRSTIQYYQHQPTLVSELDYAEDVDQKLNKTSFPTDFTAEEIRQGLSAADVNAAAVRNKNNILEFTLNPDVNILPTFYHLKVGEGVLLFKLVNRDSKTYARIPTLFNSANSNSHEYNANVDIAVSYLPKNNPSTITVPLVEDPGRFNLPPSTAPGRPFHPNTGGGYNEARRKHQELILGQYGLRRSEYILNDAEYDKMLTNILHNSLDDTNKFIAAWLRTLTVLQGKKFHINFQLQALPDGDKGTSYTSYKEGKIQVWINPFAIDSDDGARGLEHTILHELVHAVTKLGILQGEQKYEVPGKLGAAQRRAYKNLSKLLEDYRKKFLTDDAGKSTYKDLMKGAIHKTRAEQEELLNYVYPGANLAEFISAIMNRPALRERLQTLEYSAETKETFWDKIQQIFDFILEAMGLEKGSTAARAVGDIMMLASEGNTGFEHSETLRIPLRSYADIPEREGAALLEHATNPGKQPKVKPQKSGAPLEPIRKREYTPETVSKLKENEVFVFGSNTQGRHGLGAAAIAKKKFGAVQGQAEGLQGDSYAIITKDLTKPKAQQSRSVPLSKIKTGIQAMLNDARITPGKTFVVSKIGTKNAGYEVHEIAELFKALADQIPDNVVLPKEFDPRPASLSPVEEAKTDAQEEFDAAEVSSADYTVLTPEELAQQKALQEALDKKKAADLEAGIKGSITPPLSITDAEQAASNEMSPEMKKFFEARLKKLKIKPEDFEDDAAIDKMIGLAGSITPIKKPAGAKEKKKKLVITSLKIANILAQRQMEIEALYKNKQALSEKLRDPKQTQTAADFKNLRKRKLRIENQIDILESEREQIAKLASMESIRKVGKADVAKVREQLLNPGALDMRDFHILGLKINLWLNYKDNFLETDEDKQSPEVHDAFKDIVSSAAASAEKLLSLQEERIYNWAQDFLKRKISPKVFYAAMKDIGPLGKYTLGLDSADNSLLQAVAQAVLLQEAHSQEEFFELQEEVKKLVKNASGREAITGKNFRNFFEEDSNGVLTGKLVRAYSADYLAAKEDLTAAVAAGKKISKQAGNKARITLDNFRKANEIFFDVRKLVKLQGYEEQFDKNAGKLESELRALMGDVKYEEALTSAVEKWHSYFAFAENKREELEDKNPNDPVGAKNAYASWEMFNSLPAYLEFMGNPNTKVHSKATYGGWQNAVSVPRASSASGKSQYSAQYLKLQQDPSVAALHKYMLDLLEKIRGYIPENEKREFSENSLPSIEKTLVEMLKTEGMVAAGVSFYDRLKLGFTSNDVTPALYGAKDYNRSLGVKVRSLSQDIEFAYTQKVRDYERSTGHILKESDPADQMKLVAFKKAASAEIQQQKSLDLPYLLAIYSEALIKYRHKTKIEDAVRIAEEVFNVSAKENLENSAGDIVNRRMPEGQSKPEYLKLSQQHHKDMLRYFLDRFYGLQKPVEGQLDLKVLTTKEKTREKTLKEELEGHKADLATLETELDTLKSNMEGAGTEDIEARSKTLQDLDLRRLKLQSSIAEVEAQLAILGRHVTMTGIVNTAISGMIVKGLGWNVFGGLTNVLIGTLGNMTEAAGGRYYNERELRFAYRVALSSTAKAATGSIFANDNAKKLNYLMRKWDILKTVSKDQFREDSAVEKAVGVAHWAQVYKITEYTNQSTVLVAMMKHQKIKDLNGKESDLWEAYGKTGEWDTKRFGDIEEKFNAQDRALFKVKVDKVIRSNHGNYAKTLEIALKEQSLGKVLATFRGWMFEGFKNRWEGVLSGRSSQDFVDDYERRGRYTSYKGASLGMGLGALGVIMTPWLGAVGLVGGAVAGRYMNKGKIDKRFKEGFENTSAFEELEWTTKYLVRKLSFGALFGKVTLDERFNEVDAMNLRKNLAEISYLLYVTGAIMVIGHMLKGGDDDDKKKGALMYAINTLYRMQQDLGFYSNPVTAMTVLQDPLPLTGLITDAFKFMEAATIKVTDPLADEIPTGIHAGESRFWRATKNMVPGVRVLQTTANLMDQKLPGL